MKRAGPLSGIGGAGSSPEPMEVRLTEGEQVYHERVAIAVLTRQAARKAVKRQLQAQGLKLARFTGREIAILASDYLLEHRVELCEAATAQYRRWVESGALRPPKPLRKSAR